MTKQISLTQGKATQIDDQDYESISKKHWFAFKDQHTYYAARSENKKIIFMHRELLQPAEGMYVDHINGDGLDNRRENLRICTKADNARNRKLSKRNKTGYKGVILKNGVYEAWIFPGKDIYLGRFRNPIDAAYAYDESAKKYFGAFAKTNF